MTLSLFLFLLAAVFAGLATFGVSMPRVHFGWAAVALVIIAAYLLKSLGWG